MKLWYPVPVCGRIHSVGGTEYERRKRPRSISSMEYSAAIKPDVFMEWRRNRAPREKGVPSLQVQYEGKNLAPRNNAHFSTHSKRVVSYSTLLTQHFNTTLWYPLPACGRIHSVGGTEYERRKRARSISSMEYSAAIKLTCSWSGEEIGLPGKREFRHYKCNMRGRISRLASSILLVVFSYSCIVINRRCIAILWPTTQG
ncbi:hypothetical protein CDAR_53991 [Caerostris darwini]|uniref:Uncharacterized protein n=1 Tax=Caerostris darwini TaxID=1538125 RepID=A0AAV4WDA2_9ARAC|nr:hypothetical protein CDAR_53991 [Caerostris darwini]